MISSHLMGLESHWKPENSLFHSAEISCFWNSYIIRYFILYFPTLCVVSFRCCFFRGGQMSRYPAVRMPCQAPISLNESINNAAMMLASRRKLIIIVRARLYLHVRVHNEKENFTVPWFAKKNRLRVESNRETEKLFFLFNQRKV